MNRHGVFGGRFAAAVVMVGATAVVMVGAAAVVMAGDAAVVMVGAAVGGAGTLSGAARSASGGEWSAPRALVGADHYAFAPQLAVSGSGKAIAGWYGGTPPMVYAGAGPSGPAVSLPNRPPWTGSKVVVALGTIGGGFGTPIVLSGRGSDSQGELQVSLSGSGTAYAAWSEYPSGRWMIATARGRQFSTPRPLELPPGSRLQKLASAPRGPVAAVWLQYGVHRAPAFRYALLDGNGRLGRTVTIAHVRSPLMSAEFAINDHGAVAATWINVGKPFGAHPRLSAETCDPTGRCRPRQTVTFGDVLGQYPNIAITLSDNETAVILASGFDNHIAGASVHVRVVQHGLWAAVSRRGGPFLATPQLSATGDHPVAAAAGLSGAVALFNVGGPPYKTLAWSTLSSAGGRFAKPTTVPNPDAIYSPVLAANLSGSFVAAWTHAARGPITNDSYSVIATTGSGGHLARPQTIAPGSDHIAANTLATGIDGHGDAIVIWSEWASNQPRGVFAATRRQ